MRLWQLLSGTVLVCATVASAQPANEVDLKENSVGFPKEGKVQTFMQDAAHGNGRVVNNYSSPKGYVFCGARFWVDHGKKDEEGNYRDLARFDDGKPVLPYHSIGPEGGRLGVMVVGPSGHINLRWAIRFVKADQFSSEEDRLKRCEQAPWSLRSNAFGSPPPAGPPPNR